MKTPAGNQPIETLKAGDLVAAKNDTTGEIAYKPILQTFQNPGKPVYTVSLVNAAGEVVESFGVTDEHPFWTQEKGWVQTDELQIGDQLVLQNSSLLQVGSVVLGTEKQATYNFAVANFRTYFVGASGVWVHNTSPCDEVKGADSTLSRKAAFREAKEKVGLARSQQPSNTYHEKIRDQQGYVEGRVYEFKNVDGSTATIREHTLCHKLGNHGSHFNSEIRNAQGIKRSLKNNADSHTYIKQD